MAVAIDAAAAAWVMANYRPSFVYWVMRLPLAAKCAWTEAVVRDSRSLEPSLSMSIYCDFLRSARVASSSGAFVCQSKSLSQ